MPIFLKFFGNIFIKKYYDYKTIDDIDRKVSVTFIYDENEILLNTIDLFFDKKYNCA